MPFVRVASHNVLLHTGGSTTGSTTARDTRRTAQRTQFQSPISAEPAYKTYRATIRARRCHPCDTLTYLAGSPCSRAVGYDVPAYSAKLVSVGLYLHFRCDTHEISIPNHAYLHCGSSTRRLCRDRLPESPQRLAMLAAVEARPPPRAPLPQVREQTGQVRLARARVPQFQRTRAHSVLDPPDTHQQNDAMP